MTFQGDTDHSRTPAKLTSGVLAQGRRGSRPRLGRRGAVRLWVAGGDSG